MGTPRAKSVLFTADQFTPTKHTTAADKAAFANRFAAFVEKGFPQHLFTKRFYVELSGTFGHIAHYSQHGFWDEFFVTRVAELRFVRMCLQWTPVGDPKWCFSDVERALQRWLWQEDHVKKLERDVAFEREVAEKAELARLKKKYPDG